MKDTSEGETKATVKTALDVARDLCIVHKHDGVVRICPTGRAACPCSAADDLAAIPADAVKQIADLKAEVDRLTASLTNQSNLTDAAREDARIADAAAYETCEQCEGRGWIYTTFFRHDAADRADCGICGGTGKVPR